MKEELMCLEWVWEDKQVEQLSLFLLYPCSISRNESSCRTELQMFVITKGTYMFGEYKVTVFAERKSHKLQINTLES